MKTPKVFFADSGLACHLGGVTNATELERSPFRGALFEGYVASEIVKSQLNRGERRELYFFRDHQGFEVDFLFRQGGDTWLVEAKAGSTPVPRDATALTQLSSRFKGPQPQCALVYRGARQRAVTEAITEGVRAVRVDDFVGELNGP